MCICLLKISEDKSYLVPFWAEYVIKALTSVRSSRALILEEHFNTITTTDALMVSIVGFTG